MGKVLRHGALLTAACVLVMASPSQAHDSEAPRNAPHSWLPEVPWVMHHWLPYEEGRLYDALGTTRERVERWLRNDHRTLADLARARDLDPSTLAGALVEPWRGQVSEERLRVLRRRALLTLTQGHLAQHIFFHLFHGTGALDRTRSIFGVRRGPFQRLRARGLTPAQIGRIGGRSPARVRNAMLRTLNSMASHGVHRSETPASQADVMLGHRVERLSCWLRRPHPQFDPGNPYGDPNGSHGFHRRGERVGLRRGSKQLTARRHPRSCWR